MLRRYTIESLFVRDSFWSQMIRQKQQNCCSSRLGQASARCSQIWDTQSKRQFSPFLPTVPISKTCNLPHTNLVTTMDQKKNASHFLDPGADLLATSRQQARWTCPGSEIDFLELKMDFFLKFKSVPKLLLSLLMSHSEPKKSMCFPQNRQN